MEKVFVIVLLLANCSPCISQVVRVAERDTILPASKMELLDEVVISASKKEEARLSAPVSVEKLGTGSLVASPSFHSYNAIQNLKEVEMLTSGLILRQVNARGFNTPTNPRFLHLVDGVDTQPPGINFNLGNLFGPSELDIERMEVLPGASSALYGPAAFNGVLQIVTKNPFDSQGLSLRIKGGINHIADEVTAPKGLYDISVRYATVIKKRIGVKFNLAYFTGSEWYGTNYSDIDPLTSPAELGANNPSRNALNIYGDEIVKSLPGIGRVSRTGYAECDLMHENARSLKLNGAVHYKALKNLELIYSFDYGLGTTGQIGSSRGFLRNYGLAHHRWEARGGSFFFRMYQASENAGDSYNVSKLAQDINRTWVRDLNGNVVAPGKADEMWFARYEYAFNGLISQKDHEVARSFADAGRYSPGTPAFQMERKRLSQQTGGEGAGIFSKSRFYHAEGQYNFTRRNGSLSIQTGGNFRYYRLSSNGTTFDDKGRHISIAEGGIFFQVSQKIFHDQLRLGWSGRFDKNENFRGRITPRFFSVFRLTDNHFLRASFQSGFRNPVPAEQYLKNVTGPTVILGGVPGNSKGLRVYENAFTQSSTDAFEAAAGKGIRDGKTQREAVEDNIGMLVKSAANYIKPEAVNTVEIGYRALIQKRFSIDVNYYFNVFRDFIFMARVTAPQSEIGTAGNISQSAASDLLTGRAKPYIIFTNAPEKVSSQGLTMGLSYLFSHDYHVTANFAWTAFNIRNAYADHIPAFNSPKWRTTLVLENSNIFKHIGFKTAFRWQDSFDWYGGLNGNRPGRIKAYSMLDLQCSYRLPRYKLRYQLGAENLLNRRIYQIYGGPAIGGIYFLALSYAL